MKAGKPRKKGKPVPRACINHPEVSGIRRCERCGSWACRDCIEEVWHQTFLRSFIAEKRRFEKELLCPDCSRRISRIRVAAYLFVLILLLVAMGAMIIGPR
ncbi:MAG: hypothetical protein ACXACI_04375 [Candidatus Hodarchaeales archaeon]|jgi:hypothetical protein